MEKLQNTYDISLRWRSYELRPPGSPPMSEDKRAMIAQGRPRLHAIAREHYGLDMNPGPSGQNTRPALIGAKFAEAAGKGPEYHARVMRAMWVDGGRVDDLDALADMAAEVGLDRAAFSAALDDPNHLAEVEADVQTAMEYGLNGVPALVFNERYYVSGAQPFDVLKRVVEKVRAEG